ncbi:MAG TPA: metallopeptidase TldD-related protein, partial [Geobacteraceae bacterium]|nr:metallopeptidase TldD-related protein [Geobacteraceae bacterium]
CSRRASGKARRRGRTARRRYLIEKGAVGEPVRGATLTGNGPEVLKKIVRVGSDLGFGIGTCGKEGQGVPVADAQPTLLIEAITVGGAA